jgi:hypothetical protein
VGALVLGLAASFAVVSSPASTNVESDRGVLDLTRVRVSETPVKLQGDWEFYWKELLTPGDIHLRLAEGGNDPHRIRIPGSWRGVRPDGERLNGTGSATFRLAVEPGEQDRNARLALRMPTIFHA